MLNASAAAEAAKNLELARQAERMAEEFAAAAGDGLEAELLAEATKKISDLTRKMDVQTNRAQRVEGELAEAETKRKAAEELASGASDAIAEVEARLAESNAMLTSVTNQLQAARSELADAAMAHAAAEESAAEARAEADRLRMANAEEARALEA